MPRPSPQSVAPDFADSYPKPTPFTQAYTYSLGPSGPFPARMMGHCSQVWNARGVQGSGQGDKLPQCTRFGRISTACDILCHATSNPVNITKHFLLRCCRCAAGIHQVLGHVSGQPSPRGAGGWATALLAVSGWRSGPVTTCARGSAATCTRVTRMQCVSNIMYRKRRRGSGSAA